MDIHSLYSFNIVWSFSYSRETGKGNGAGKVKSDIKVFLFKDDMILSIPPVVYDKKFQQNLWYKINTPKISRSPKC